MVIWDSATPQMRSRFLAWDLPDQVGQDGLMASKQGERTLADYSLISGLLPARVNGILWGCLMFLHFSFH